jgi:integrase
MASVFKKSRDRTNKLASWYIAYQDENGRRRTVKGCPDKTATEAMARKLESDADLRRRGVVDPKAEAYAAHEARPLTDHLDAWGESLKAEGATAKHVGLTTSRMRRIVALICGAKLSEVSPVTRNRRGDVARAHKTRAERMVSARLSDLTTERVQKALATLKTEGQSHQTLNHYRGVVRSFSRWCWKSHRTREDALRDVKGYNVKEDRRHDRRTLSLDELRRLIDAAEHGPAVRRVPGPVRALVYRLAVATGLRYSEIGSITPESFNWETPSVTVAAAYTKNGDPATLPLPRELADDLAAYVATLAPGVQVFPLPRYADGARVLLIDLKAAGIPYQDASGLFFDFHALRCQTATLADQAGVSPRVVQKLMRHSTLELTGRYTRPRAVDIEAAASKLPSLKPEGDRLEAGTLAATGTDPRPLRYPCAANVGAAGQDLERNSNKDNTLTSAVTPDSRRCCRPTAASRHPG